MQPGILGPQFVTPFCSKLSVLGWAVGCSTPSVAPRDRQPSPPLPWKAYILHRVLFLVVWAKANESVFTKVLLMGRSVWKTLLWPPNLGRKQNSNTEWSLGKPRLPRGPLKRNRDWNPTWRISAITSITATLEIVFCGLARTPSWRMLPQIS